ncbi:hypothetical protein [Antrihabitans spumae]|uniref:Uncharacterized protein n=1 Tax=Antrihabitans spumae TaxID=3373370 RepID=A0ABW7KNA4_9NOCA
MRKKTIFFDPDVVELIESSMRHSHLTFDEVVNGTVRLALGKVNPSTPTYDMGRPTIDVVKALTYSGLLEHFEYMRRTN